MSLGFEQQNNAIESSVQMLLINRNFNKTSYVSQTQSKFMKTKELR